MANIESNRNVARASSRTELFKWGLIFLLVGPPIFGLLFYLATSAAHVGAPDFFEEISQVPEQVFSLYGLLASYLAGSIPSLIAALAYLRSTHNLRTTGRRLLVAVPIGAAVYFAACCLVLVFLFGDQIEASTWLFAAYAAAAGAFSTVVCALVVQFFKSTSARHPTSAG